MTMRFAFPGLLSVLMLPQVHSQGYCVGNSGMCAGQTNCEGCDFFGCTWYLFNDNPGNFCSGGGSCTSKNTCKTCEQLGGCKWVATIETSRPITQMGDGVCSGDSIHCDGQQDCTSCTFWSGCKWNIYPGEQGDTCIGASMRCASSDSCKDCQRVNDWDRDAQCSWQPTCRGSSPICASRYNDASCECHPECTWGNHFSSNTKNYTQECVGSPWCAEKTDCGRCRSSWSCKWARVPKSHGPRPFCEGKPSGLSCQGDWLTHCQMNIERSTVNCGEGMCTGNDGRASCFCDGKRHGQYCKGDDILSCPSGRKDGRCPDGSCVSEGYGKTCGVADFCKYRANGTYCDGSYLKECGAGSNSGLAYCGSGSCTLFESGKMAECGTRNFCSNRTTAAYCDGDVFKACVDSSSVPRSQMLCEYGCKIQDHQAVCKSEDTQWIGHARTWGSGVMIMLLALHATIG